MAMAAFAYLSQLSEVTRNLILSPIYALEHVHKCSKEMQLMPLDFAVTFAFTDTQQMLAYEDEHQP